MPLIIRDDMVFAVYPDGSQTQATPKQCADEIERLRTAIFNTINDLRHKKPNLPAMRRYLSGVYNNSDHEQNKTP